MPGLQLNLFGGFELRRGDGAPLALSSKKAKALLAYLALALGRPVSRDKLATLLWSASGDEQARGSLRQTLSVLRKAVADPEGRLLVTTAQGLSVDAGALDVDVVRFEAGIAGAGRRDLELAVEAYKGQLLDGFEVRAEVFEEWLRGERLRLNALAASAAESLMKADRDDGDSDAALSMARRLLRLDPLREDVHRTVMALLQEQKRWNEAIKHYDDCAGVLRAELDIAPQEQTQALHREILRQRDAVEQQRIGSAIRGSVVADAPLPGPPGARGKPSIVVLPFENLSAAAAPDYFSDGITEDIITELSRFASLFVIARNSTFTYKDRAVSVQDVHSDSEYLRAGSLGVT